MRRAKQTLPPRRVPMLGLTAAFVFAAQMLNFPVAAGTSGHLIGGVLVSVLLGPSAAVLVMSSVLIVQCIVFADGGLLALGANVFNMGIISSVGGYAIYRSVRSIMPQPRGRLVAVAFASWVATVAAAIVCAGELAISGRVRWAAAFPAMAGVHMLIGVGEAVATTLVVFTLSNTRPDLLEEEAAVTIESRRSSRWELLVFGLLISLGLVLFVAPFASTAPDGLDWVANQLSFAERAATARALPTPLPDYQLPGIRSAALATALAGAVGTIVVFVLAMQLARLLLPKAAIDPAPVLENSV